MWAELRGPARQFCMRELQVFAGIRLGLQAPPVQHPTKRTAPAPMFGSRISELIERTAEPESPNSLISLEEPCSSTDSPESSSSLSDPGASPASEEEHPEGAAASARCSAPDVEPVDPLSEIHLDVEETPWASSTLDIDEFIQIYLTPGDSDFESLDQYLPRNWDCEDRLDDDRHPQSS